MSMSLSRSLRERFVAVTQRQRRDAGVTIFELLVVMSIFAVVMALCFKVLTTVQKQTGDNLSQAEAVETARLGLANIDRQIRSAETLWAPTSSAPMSLRAYIAVAGPPRCLQFEVTPTGELRSRTWTSTGAVSGWRTLATGLVNNGTTARPFEVVGSNQVTVRLLVKPHASASRPIEVATSLTKRNNPLTTPSTLCDTVP